MSESKLALFDQKEIRKVWYKDDWYFSVIDVIYALTESTEPKRYWSDLKIKLKEEGNIETYDFIVRLKMLAKDGKSRITDCADTKGMLRIIQSIPSPKAEPFKQWLATVGAQRIEEINDPELAINRAKETYTLKGYSQSWIEQRILGIKNRHKLTDEWKNRGITNSNDYGILTNQIYKYGFGYTAKEMRENFNLSKKANVRDNFTEIGLALTNLGEVTARELHVNNNSNGLEKLKDDTKIAGIIMKNTRLEIENNLNNKETILNK